MEGLGKIEKGFMDMYNRMVIAREKEYKGINGNGKTIKNL